MVRSTRLTVVGALATATLVLTGCVTVEPTTAAPPQVSVRDELERNYAIGAAKTVNVGDTVVRVRAFKRTETTRDGYTASEDFEVRTPIEVTRVSKADRLITVGRRDIKGVSYDLVARASQVIPGLPTVALQIGPDGVAFDHMVSGNEGVWIQALPTVTIYPSSVRFRRGLNTTSTLVPGDLNYEIVFTGNDGQAMRFQYREYTADNLARPAFSQDLSYPISAQTIRYRNLSISVLGITADQITYRVDSD